MPDGHPTVNLETVKEDLRRRADSAPRVATSKGKTLPLEWFGSAELATDLGDFVEGVLTDGGMSVVYGESNSGKTFFAFDLALRVALGWDWQGRETEPGGVLYLACEGGYGVRNREIAFRMARSVETGAPFATVRASVNLRDPDGDTDKVLETAEAMRQHTGKGVRLIVVDTLARALAGGEENSSQDMGAIVRHVDKIRYETGAHVMLIHHSGKDTAKGARGHSSLRAATDTELEIVRPEDGDVATAVVRKQRDLPGDGRFPFQLQQVQLGTDRRGNMVTSCVVEPAEDPGKPHARVKLSDEQKGFMDEVRNALADQGENVRPYEDMAPVQAIDRTHLRTHLTACGFFDPHAPANQVRARMSDYLRKLKGKGLLGLSDQYVWIADQTARTARTPHAPRTHQAGAHRTHRTHAPMGACGACAQDQPCACPDDPEPDPFSADPEATL